MRIIPLRAGLDPLALLLALVSPLQSLAEFLGAVAFHRPPDQDAQAPMPAAPAGGVARYRLRRSRTCYRTPARPVDN